MATHQPSNQVWGLCPHVYVMRRGEGDLNESLLGREGNPGAGSTFSKCLEAGMNLEHGLGELQGRIVELRRPRNLSFNVLREYSRSFNKWCFICSTYIY